MTQLFRSSIAALALTVLAGAAQAQGWLAFAAKDIHLRAGPARDYPVVAIVPAGVELQVQGCLPNYSWCDVLAGPNRGWVYAGNISYPYQGARVPVLTYGAVIGIGVLGFVINDYWHDYYRGRPWYGDRDRWIHRPHLRPAPLPRPFPPPHGVRPEHPRLPQPAAPIGAHPPLGAPHRPGPPPRAPGPARAPGHEPRGDRPQR
ncbi:SH3 domain-containing protein [Caenimonas terrae]|uniref:SH3 domain-containing protein n=1 Tax=Caenimonas terrae TaxID=696074 RepID=A0ABW0NBK3_9BURK